MKVFLRLLLHIPMKICCFFCNSLLANRLLVWKLFCLFVIQQNRSQQNTVAALSELCLAYRSVAVLSCKGLRRSAALPRYFFNKYIELCVSFLTENRSLSIFSMSCKPWNAKGTIVSWRKRAVDFSSCLAKLRPKALHVMFPCFPEVALHRKYLRKQKGIRLLLSSQERKAL